VSDPVDEEVVLVVLRFDPFRDFDRLAEQLFAGGGGDRVPMAMPMDLYRSGDHYVLHCDLPGIDPGSVDVNVEGSTLTIRAERSGRTEEGVQWLRHERPFGNFQRQVALGEGLDLDSINATYHEGVLTVTIPVAERAKPRRIQITTAEAPASRVLEGTSTETAA
jgi:HSP20 family protein